MATNDLERARRIDIEHNERNNNELRKSQSLSNLVHNHFEDYDENANRVMRTTISTDDIVNAKTASADAALAASHRVSLMDKKRLQWSQDLSLYICVVYSYTIVFILICCCC
jgi:glycyl-tRNA synthetase alpha subunit